MMVKEEIKNNKNYFICEECDFAYEVEKWAKKCEGWCKEHHSCNIEITKHAVQTE